jgi:hypothetical protein
MFFLRRSVYIRQMELKNKFQDSKLSLHCPLQTIILKFILGPIFLSRADC